MGDFNARKYGSIPKQREAFRQIERAELIIRLSKLAHRNEFNYDDSQQQAINEVNQNLNELAIEKSL